MHSDKGCVRIDVTLSPSAVLPEFVRNKPKNEKCSTISRYIRDLWEFAKEDKKRIVFSLKVGLAMLIVSLLVLVSQPYEIFGTNIVYSILTVAIMFEYTVGATFNRGFNRAAGTLVAGICALTVIQIIVVVRHAAEPYIIGVSIFLVAVVTSFMKLWPPLVPYEHCFRVTLFTYCLIIVSAYRNSNPVYTALTRLYCIAIGATVAVLVNVLVFPAWAGEQLHKELVASFHAVADSLEECVKKYLNGDGSEHLGFSQSITDEFPDEPSFQQCNATLNSSARIDFLANSAKWEPPHGRFRLFYPWSQYVKVGAVLRRSAYEVMALHQCLHSEIQGPYCMKLVPEEEIREAASRGAELLCHLANNLSNMKHTPIETMSILQAVHNSIHQLLRSIKLNSILFASLTNSLSLNLDNYYSVSKTNARAYELLSKSEARIDIMRGKEMWWSRSWPSIEARKMIGEKIDPDKIFPGTKFIESIEALSFCTFVLSLIEFVARLDHLVDAVDELSKLAKFKEEQVL